jgi:GT2 family glycosyltransferase
MNFKVLAGHMAQFKKMIKTRGLGFAIQSVLWHIKTGWQKAWIGIEDRLGWFSYARWIRDNEVAHPPLALDKVETARDGTEAVRLSFLIPYRQGNLAPRRGGPSSTILVSQTIGSLIAQTSSAWEACLFGLQPEAFSLTIGDLSREDIEHHVRIRWFADVGAEADSLSNVLMQARGEWVMILYPGDTVSPDVCAELSLLAQQSTPPEIIYFDQDQLSEGKPTRKNPVFRPDWSPELLLSVNYLENACFRRDLLRTCAAQSQNSGEALLRCVEQAGQIVHIPRILYHQASAAATEGLLNLRFSPSDAATHLRRLGVADAQIAEDALKRARFSWPVSGRLVSIIIPSRDRREYLERCLASIHHLTHYRNFEIVIVDNNSQDVDTLAYYAQLQQAPSTTILKNQSVFNYSAYNNLGARHAHGDLLLFLNNDVEVIDPCWLDELVQWAERSEIGAVGAKLLYPDGSIQHAGIVVGMEGHGSHVFMGQREGYTSPFGSVDWYRDVSAVTGACLMMRREVFEKIGAFDENYLLVFNDIEICVRVLAHGYRVVYNPFARLIHYEGKSRGRYIPPDDIHLGYEHLKETVAQGDSYYNQNLSYAVRVPTLRRTWEEDRLQRLETIVRLAF